MRRAKLYSLTSKGFKLPSHVDSNGIDFVSKADSIPVMLWPDGRWCFTANAYMLSLYSAGRSRRNGGGTLATYAANISHLLRFCSDNRIELNELSDNEFTLFINNLKGERRAGQPQARVREAETVIRIGRKCLDFLDYVGEQYQIVNFVGPEGQICATKRVAYYSGKKSARRNISVNVKYWHHRSFPIRNPKVKRLPIGAEDIKKMRESIRGQSSNRFIRKRRYVMLMLLDITGGRRSEIVDLRVSSVLEIENDEKPMLKILTAKRRGGKESHRLLPISHHDVKFLIEFINMNRKLIIRRTCGVNNDDDHLLISKTTGRGLVPNTITQEVGKLAKAAGISGQTCPQMFRHRFFTSLFVTLIQHHELQNPDDFRRALVDDEGLKLIVTQWAGHLNPESIDVYLHLAFAEFAGLKKTYDLVITHRAIDSFRSSLHQMQDELRGGDDPGKVAARLARQLDALEVDLSQTEDMSE